MYEMWEIGGHGKKFQKSKKSFSKSKHATQEIFSSWWDLMTLPRSYDIPPSPFSTHKKNLKLSHVVIFSYQIPSKYTPFSSLCQYITLIVFVLNFISKTHWRSQCRCHDLTNNSSESLTTCFHHHISFQKVYEQSVEHFLIYNVKGLYKGLVKGFYVWNVRDWGSW